jgi:hypothetical protein
MPGDESLRQLRVGLEAKPADWAAGGWVVTDGFAEPRSRIPPQETGTLANLIDLSDYHIVPLSEALDFEWFRWTKFNNLYSLPRGVQVLAGVKFDVRGAVRLLGIQLKALGRYFPERTTGIKIGQPCRRLHFLHGTEFDEVEGKEIARFIMHFSNGQNSEKPIRYGNDVQNWWLKASDRLERRALRAVRTGQGAPRALILRVAPVVVWRWTAMATSMWRTLPTTRSAKATLHS